MKLMDALKRLFGISGHNTQRALIIAAAADDLTRESVALNAKLKEYQARPDPFMALMTDLHNRRQMGANPGHER